MLRPTHLDLTLVFGKFFCKTLSKAPATQCFHIHVFASTYFVSDF